MRIVKKALLIVFVMILLIGQCFACVKKPSSINSKYDPDSVDYNMNGTVRVWWGSTDPIKDPLFRSIERFNAKFPNITVKVELQTHSDYLAPLNLAYMNGTAPDVIRMDHVGLQSLGESKRVLDMQAVTANKHATLDKAKFLPASWQGISIGDAVYGYPFDTNTTLLMYNEKICKEVFGNDYTPPKTYDELKADSLAVYNYEKSGKKPYKGLVMAIDANGSEHDIYVLNGWLSRYGATILNDDRSKATLNSPQAIEAMQKLYELKEAGAVQHTGYAPTLENEFLYNGTTAFIEMGSWVFRTIEALDQNDDGISDIKIAPMPILKEGVAGYATLGLFGLGVTSQCAEANVPAAYEFIKFLATDYDSHLDYSKSTDTMPTLVAGQDDKYYSEGENKEFWQAFKTQLQISLPRPGTMLWPELVTQLKTMERNLMLGRYETKVLMDNTVKTINEMFEEMRG